MAFQIKHLLIATSIVFFLLGRLCDDLAWYVWPGISAQKLEGIAIAGLGSSAIIIIIIKAREDGGCKLIFFDSQLKFIIPWSLVILEAILVFNIFTCHHDDAPLVGQQMTYAGCCTFSVTILLTNLNYALSCHQKSELPFLITFETVLFAQIIFNGNLLVVFVNDLTEKHKDYSILFTSIMIAWQVLVMDLLFRAAYEDKKKHQKHENLEKKVHEHHEICRSHHGTHSLIANSTPAIEMSNTLNNIMESNKQIKNGPL